MTETIGLFSAVAAVFLGYLALGCIGIGRVKINGRVIDGMDVGCLVSAVALLLMGVSMCIAGAVWLIGKIGG